ncbi:hypothetical protein BDL97_11G016100 [Sphagnum fallax]|nr:hypothetical protein BDL97_11G016100 [Sphagnum fallax]
MAVVAKVQQLIQENPLIVFSKTYCPYCARVKQLLKSLGATGKIIELNNENDGGAMQAALVEISKQHTCTQYLHQGQTPWRL